MSRMYICYISFLIIIILLLVIGIIICRIISSNNSKLGKKTHAICEDLKINTIFKGIKITGIELLESLLKSADLYEKYSIKLTHLDGRIGCVKVNSIELSKDFEKTLELETFRDILHEYRHVLDSKLLKCMRYGMYGWGIGTLIIVVEILLVVNRIINPHWILILFCIIPIVSFFIFIYFKINTEIRAIKFVPSKSKSVLNGLGIKQDDERIITEYLNSQIKSIYTWYTLENISKYTLILVFTLFCILALLLVIQY